METRCCSETIFAYRVYYTNLVPKIGWRGGTAMAALDLLPPRGHFPRRPLFSAARRRLHRRGVRKITRPILATAFVVLVAVVVVGQGMMQWGSDASPAGLSPRRRLSSAYSADQCPEPKGMIAVYLIIIL